MVRQARPLRARFGRWLDVSAIGRFLLTLRHAPLQRNSIVLMINSGTGMLFGMVFWVVGARLYSPPDIGLAAALVSASGLISLLSLLGFDLGLVRFLPGAHHGKTLITSCLTMSTVVSMAASAIFIAGVPLWTPELRFLQSAIPALLFIATTAAGTLIALQAQVFIARRRPEYAWTQTLISSMGRIPLAFLLIAYGGQGIWQAWVISTIVGAAVGYFTLIKTESEYSVRPSIDMKTLRGIASFSAGGYISNLAGTAPVYVLPLITLSVLGPEATAYYYLGYRVASVLYTLPWLVGMSLFVEGSHAPVRLKQLSSDTLKLVLAVIAVGLFIVLIFGRKLLLLFGAQYSESALWVLWAVSISAIPYAFNEVFLVIQRVRLKVAVTVYFSALIGAVVIGSSFLLLPRLGLPGAGLGWLIGHAAGAVCVALWFYGPYRRKALD